MSGALAGRALAAVGIVAGLLAVALDLTSGGGSTSRYLDNGAVAAFLVALLLNSRVMRRPISWASGPSCCAASPMRPSSGPTKPTLTLAETPQPAIATSIQKWFQPQCPFSTRATPRPNAANSAVGVDTRPDPATHLAERSERLAVTLALEDHPERGQRHIAADPDHDRQHIQREVDLIRPRREPEEDDHHADQHDSREHRGSRSAHGACAAAGTDSADATLSSISGN